LKRWLGAALFVVAGVITAYVLTQPIFDEPAADAEQVILLHGLGRSETAMLFLENELAGAGYEVHNIGYPSNDGTPEALLKRVTEAIDRCCANNDRPLHFVGHSLGGLLVRAYLDRAIPSNLGRVVLLGTPNKGSELADQTDGLAAILVEYAGPTAQLLGTGPDSFPASIGPPHYPVGVIAGTFDGGISNEWLPLPNDSMVSLESAKLEGMTDFAAFNVTHWGLRNDSDVAAATIRFLQQGSFGD